MEKTKVRIDVPQALQKEQVEFQVYNIISDLEQYDMEFEINYTDSPFFDVNVIENHLPEEISLIKFYFGWQETNQIISEIASKCMYELRKEIKKDDSDKKVFIGLWSDKTEFVAIDKSNYDLSKFNSIVETIYNKIKNGEKVYWDEIDEYMDTNNLGGQTFVKNDESNEPIGNYLQIFDLNNPEKKGDMIEFDPKTIRNHEFLELIKEEHKKMAI